MDEIQMLDNALFVSNCFLERKHDDSLIGFVSKMTYRRHVVDEEKSIDGYHDSVLQ
jgi:hypothetical protein